MADQRGRSASRQAGRPALATSSWDVAVREPACSALRCSELQRIDAELLREVVHEGLVGDGRLRDAEAAEGAGRGTVRVDGAAGAEH